MHFEAPPLIRLHSGALRSAAEMCGILKVSILGSPRTVGRDRSSPGTFRDFDLWS